MALAPGTRLGPYEVTALLGVGGMGEVYRATDTNLKRQVAIKVLPESVAADAERLARFQREAEVLAALNHPNIAGIYGLERSNGVTALVMELVEGEDLSEVIRSAGGATGADGATGGADEDAPKPSASARALRDSDSAARRRGWGPAATRRSGHGLPIDDTLPIARQIADALEAAHELGIVHRDLKPANVKVRADGTVKVLDFGLAKAVEPVSVTGSASVSMSPTITTPAMTQMGMILGTAAYMSPEQASGRPVDRRSDLWAFGVVLLEMLTGRRIFDGETVSHVLASVLKDAPDLTALPTDTPASIRRLLRRCLEKNPKQRIDSAAAARLEIDDALSGREATEAAGGPSRTDEGTARSTWKHAWPLVVAALAIGVLVTGGVTWAVWPTAAPGQVRRSISVLPDDVSLPNTLNRSVVGVSPDASAVVHVTAAGLYLRPADELEGRLLPGTNQAAQPVFSPDGKDIAFFQAGALMRIPTVGGGPVVITSGPLPNVNGMSWSDDGTILFGLQDGIYQVPATGGTPNQVIEAKEGEFTGAPQMLPDGTSVLFTVILDAPGNQDPKIAVQTPGRDDRTVLLNGVGGRYLPTGHLVFAQGNTLFGIAFDADRRTVSGGPVSLVQNVLRRGNVSHFAVAALGELIYLRDGSVADTQRTLAWIDRQGQETAIPVPPRPYTYPRISPDGTRIAVSIDDGDQDIWVWDLARTTLTRVTVTPSNDQSPVWSFDSRRLFFRSRGEGLFAISADGTGTAEQLTTSRNVQTPSALTPDGTQLLFFEIVQGTNNDNDVLQVEVAQGHTVTPLVQDSSAFNGVVSPDGRWLAYHATDSGAAEVYVRPYPDVNSGRYLVSTNGGSAPLWSPDGRELFYRKSLGGLMRVGVEPGDSWRATIPEQLLADGSVPGVINSPSRSYDISPDGQKFLVLRSLNAETSSAPQIVVIQRFDELLKRQVPMN